ncbi:TOBE domain-containing protein [Salinirubrum litoreum]|uniref:TOBE domain-containing protein n=1 Tax=Salinirubrum litoreum TaxID=1126234 RepID=A0ABD5RFT2_9EURY|nr:TOBE domain-containing protein [Salinirubrum litoreum]
MDVPSEFDARLGGGDVTLTERDVRLLRRIDDHGSINAAATDLGRSYSRAQRRVVELESAFGDLVERQRGGAAGGGSRLTDHAVDLLSQYDRLCVEFASVVETRETVLSGTVAAVDGDLVSVETPAGTIRAVVPGDGTDRDGADGGVADRDGRAADRTDRDGAEVRLTIRADAVTLHAPDHDRDPNGTSARNRLSGTVGAVDPGESVAVVTVDVGTATPLSAIVTDESVERLALSPGREVVASFKATATHGVVVGRESA